MDDHSRNFSLDVWRGIAVSLILLLHARALTPDISAQSPLSLLFQNMIIGVHLFFVLSGYLISKSWSRSDGIQEFCLRRAAKIVPLYMLFLVISIGAFLIGSRFMDGRALFRNNVTWSNLTLDNVLVHLTFMQGLFPRYTTTLLDGSWSIVIEVYFYALYPILQRYIVRGINSAVIFWIGAVCLQRALAMPVHDFAAAQGYPSYSVYYFGAALPSFALGMALFQWEREGILPLNAGVTAGAIATVYLSAAWFQQGYLLIQNVLMPVAVFCVAKIDWPTNVISRTVAAFGRQTYALYFVHMVLLVWLTNLVTSRISHEVQSHWLFVFNLFVAFPLSYLLSNAIFNRIDRFFVRTIEGVYKRRIFGSTESTLTRNRMTRCATNDL
jgi:peptidoglycan/LPS O-acetylase OafA/YrhL